MWRRGLLYTLLAATVAATATDGETQGAFLVKNTPCEKTSCKIARNPGSLDIAGLKLRAQRMSSCACELAYALHIFIGCLAAYFMAKTAAERLEKFKHLVRVLSVFLVHYSRDLAIAQIPVPLLSVMELTTGLRSSKGLDLADRPACDIEARQKEVGCSFYAERYCSRPVHKSSNDRLITSRYAINVLAYSEPALRWPTVPVLFYNTHNGSGGAVFIYVPLANVVNAWAHANSGGLDPCSDPFNLQWFWSDTLSLVDFPAGNIHHHMAQHNYAAHHVLNHGALPGGPQLHILGGDPGDAREGYDLDVDAIDDDDAAAEADGDGDAFMADAPAPAAFDVVALDCAVAPAADAGVALRDAALERLAAALLARVAEGGLRCFPFEAAPAPAPSFLAEGAGGHPCAAVAFSRPEAPSLVPTSSRRRLPKALDALLDKFWLAPPPVLERLASDDVAVARVTDALAGRAARSFTATAALDGDVGARTTLYGARDAGGALSVCCAAAGTVLAPPTARCFSRDAPEVASLLLAHGANVSLDARDASGSYAPLHLAAGALGPSSMEEDPPEDATPADGPADAVDANGAAVPTTTTPTAQSDLDPELTTRYKSLLATLKNYRDNGFDGNLGKTLDSLVKGLGTPDGDPMGNKSKYMIRNHWTAPASIPGKRKPKNKFLNPEPFRDALIKELESFLGLEPSTVDEALDDDDDEADEAVPEASPEEARRWIRNLKLKLYSAQRLKQLCAQFGVDYSDIKPANERNAIKRVLVPRLEKIVAEAGEEISVGERARAAMAAIEAEAVGDGLEASPEEFERVLKLVMGDDMPPPLTTGDDFFSVLFRGLSPSKPNDASRPQRRRRASEEKETLLSGVLLTFVTFLDVNDVSAIKAVSRVALAVMPERKALSMMVRRLSACNDSTDPESFKTLLMAQFLAVDPCAEEPEVIQKCTGIMRNLLYNQDLVTAIEGSEGRGMTSAELVRHVTNNVPHARLELEQLLLKEDDRDEWFRELRNEHLACTTNTQIKAHTLEMLVELHVEKILRGATNHRLDEVVSKPSAHVKVTLGTSLTTWRDSSDVLRECFMDLTKKLKSGNYGDARNHSTATARNIIRDASAAIETRLAELTKGYPAEFDEAIEFLLERFKPEGEAEAAEAAAWRARLKNPKHVAAVAQKATGQVQPKVKRGEVGRAKAVPSRADQRKKKH